jgi:hypothetical protein
MLNNYEINLLIIINWMTIHVVENSMKCDGHTDKFENIVTFDWTRDLDRQLAILDSNNS